MYFFITCSEFQQVSSFPSTKYCFPKFALSLFKTELTLKRLSKPDSYNFLYFYFIRVSELIKLVIRGKRTKKWILSVSFSVLNKSHIIVIVPIWSTWFLLL